MSNQQHTADEEPQPTGTRDLPEKGLFPLPVESHDARQADYQKGWYFIYGLNSKPVWFDGEFIVFDNGVKMTTDGPMYGPLVPATRVAEVQERLAQAERRLAEINAGGKAGMARQADLHQAIMNLPCNLQGDHSYALGHRDARHAAAELALGYVPATQLAKVEQRLEEKELSHEGTLKERVECEECIDRIYLLVTGQPSEWSNNFDYKTAADIVEQTMWAKDQEIGHVQEAREQAESERGAGGNYIADHDTYPQTLWFANGRRVQIEHTEVKSEIEGGKAYLRIDKFWHPAFAAMKPVEEFKYLNSECGLSGCQWLVAQHQVDVYRKQMADAEAERDALRAKLERIREAAAKMDGHEWLKRFRLDNLLKLVRESA